MSFKPGHRVKCISTGANPLLRFGETYRVAEVKPCAYVGAPPIAASGWVRLDGFEEPRDWYFASRFVREVCFGAEWAEPLS